MVLLRRVHCPS